MTNEQLALALDIFGNNDGLSTVEALNPALGRDPSYTEALEFWRSINKRLDLTVKWAALEAVARLRTEKGE